MASVNMKENQKQVNESTQEVQYVQGRCWFQVLAIFAVSIAAFNSATLFYWSSPSIPLIVQDEVFNTTQDEASYLAIIPTIGMVIGTPFYSGLIDILGRKFLILTMAFLHLTGWLMIAFSRSMLPLLLSRLYGLADACLFAIIPVYIGEISTPNVRSSYGNLMMILIYLGQFAINAVGYYAGDIKLTSFIFMPFPVVFFALFIFMPETPYYYIAKGKEEEALSSLKRLRRQEDDALQMEFAQMKSDVKRQLMERGKWKDLLSKTNRRAMTVCTTVRVIQQFSGVSAFALYTQSIFKNAVGGLNRGESAMIYTGTLAMTNLFGSVVLDHLGRRKALVLSSIGCTIALFIEAIYLYLSDVANITTPSLSWIPLAGLCVYVIFFSCGLSIVPTTIMGELFSASIKSKASCVMNIIFAILIGSSTKLFDVFTSTFGSFVAFGCFGIFTFVGIFVSWYVVPETKGKTLEEIQQDLKK
ncbi:hypothetical protein Trydic_g8920 [Trypoxylus dichotomus]